MGYYPINLSRGVNASCLGSDEDLGDGKIDGVFALLHSSHCSAPLTTPTTTHSLPHKWLRTSFNFVERRFEPSWLRVSCASPSRLNWCRRIASPRRTRRL